MKKVILATKVILLAIFGIIAALSLLMFPTLIGDNDPKTATLGYSYLGLLLISATLFYFIIRREIKPSKVKV
ncbi:hypothetical protein [Tenacibaculum jejuense]|uniref:Uncharacterized protein n=1 Tax=Tenacibaculum jejuense TaxID=584609 RepID=A0A238U652_9FLAO|nr:hypothetical protein [Tenacibaculum jejuense]SNR14691.1 protein of unknown function [Tenacibaculum jejuense]